MVITREFINGHQRFTIDGEIINRRELEIRCAKYFNWYGLQAMFHKLIYEGKFLSSEKYRPLTTKHYQGRNRDNLHLHKMLLSAVSNEKPFM